MESFGEGHPHHDQVTGMTEFEERVYEAVRSVPRGFAVSYGEVARFIGCRSARAVGAALRRNPSPETTPCYRVVSVDGALTGFFGSSAAASLARKRRLLEADGVGFNVSGRVAKEFLWLWNR